MDQKISSDKRFALLIDADNVSARYIKPILNELSKYGTVTVKRIYGDWTLSLHAKWKDALLENSITPIQQFSYTQGKNATDSAMIIDAMDILYTESVEGFCIVASDSDFTRLASRLREGGQFVIGMGEKKTPTPFRRACDVFTTLELLTESKQELNNTGLSKKDVEKAVIDIVEYDQNNDKVTRLSEVGNRLLKRYPDFDVRSYGTNLLSKLLGEFSSLDVSKENDCMYVRLANSKDTNENKGKNYHDENTSHKLSSKSTNHKTQNKHYLGKTPERTQTSKISQTSKAEKSNKASRQNKYKKQVKNSKAKNKKQPIKNESNIPLKAQNIQKVQHKKSDKKSKVSPEQHNSAATPNNLQNIIRRIVGKAGKQGIPITKLNNALHKELPNFKVRNTGYSQLRLYIASLGQYSVDKVDKEYRVKLAR